MPKKKKVITEQSENTQFNWFPGHMNKAVKEIKKNIKLVNMIIEVRDARVPMASGNKANYDNNGEKPYLIVFNKTNLANPDAVQRWKKWLTKQGESFIFINALEKKSTKAIIQRSKEILQAHRLNSNSSVSLKEKMKLMVLGLPNTGKSTIINTLANRNATKSAANPGQTKGQLWVKADHDLDILDTPGVMPPKFGEQVHGMWLSAIHAIPDHIITPEYSACFIIEYLLKTKSAEFKEYYEFESLDIDLLTVCDHIGKRRGCLRSGGGGGYDYDHIYKIILNDFRKGVLGLISFELPPSQ